MSISAQSAASTPPASERMVTSASRASYCPDSRVRTSSSDDGLLQGGELGLGLEAGGLVALLLGHLEEHADVVDAAAQALDAVDLALDVGQLRGDLLGVVLVVPEVGGGRGLVELGQLGRHRGTSRTFSMLVRVASSSRRASELSGAATSAEPTRARVPVGELASGFVRAGPAPPIKESCTDPDTSIGADVLDHRGKVTPASGGPEHLHAAARTGLDPATDLLLRRVVVGDTALGRPASRRSRSSSSMPPGTARARIRAGVVPWIRKRCGTPFG